MSQPDAIAFSGEIRAMLLPACRRAARVSTRLRSTSLPSDQREEIVMAQLWEEVLPMLPADDDDLLNEDHPTGWSQEQEDAIDAEIQQDLENESRDLDREYRRTCGRQMPQHTHTEAMATCRTTTSS